MTDIVESGGSKYEDYERLLLKRDQLNKEADQIWIAYVQTFGALMTENYEEKLECVKCKKTIAYYQSVLNRGGTVGAQELQEHLEREMTGYYERLREMLDDNERANKAGRSSEYEVRRSKELYRRLARLIHPDLNPATDGSEELQELWHRAVIAYGKNSVKELTELEVLVRKVIKELGLGDVRAEIPDVTVKIRELVEEIDEIRSTEPYSLKHLVEDEKAAQKKKDEIAADTAEYKRYRRELEEIIVKMIANGGLHFYVE